MKQQVVFLLSLLLVVLASCKNEQKQEVYNPFATPEGCVKEYLAAKDSNNVAKMLNCFKYEAQYESMLREHLQEILEKDDRYKDIHYEKTDSVKLKEMYPNSSVVTVFYTSFDSKTHQKSYSDSYTMNLVKDSTNWKIEVRIGFGISAN
jgi:hypothetical protein